MKFLKKILLVDHEPNVTALVRRALESTGNYLVKVQQDSQLALHAAPWFSPDLIMLDAARESEGDAVNRQLKADPSLKDTPFLFLSANAALGKKVVTGGFISGYSFLATAVSLDDLIRCVDEMLSPAAAATTGYSPAQCRRARRGERPNK
jgi:CheY-like chemotaxis protein